MLPRIQTTPRTLQHTTNSTITIRASLLAYLVMRVVKITLTIYVKFNTVLPYLTLYHVNTMHITWSVQINLFTYELEQFTINRMPCTHLYFHCPREMEISTTKSLTLKMMATGIPHIYNHTEMCQQSSYVGTIPK